MKTLAVAGRYVALQLWDTAGQERYRSIARQYFRKADGVVVMFDVTNEKSFLSVRGWMQSVQVSWWEDIEIAKLVQWVTLSQRKICKIKIFDCLLPKRKLLRKCLDSKITQVKLFIQTDLNSFYPNELNCVLFFALSVQ